MKQWMLFGYRFTVCRFKRYEVLLSNDHKTYTSAGRFDSLKTAGDFLISALENELVMAGTGEVYGSIYDLHKAEYVGGCSGFDSVETVRVNHISGFVGKRIVK